MGKYSQTEEAKAKFESPMLNYMKRVIENDKHHIFTKDELIAALSLTEREVRRQVALIANYYPLFSFSNKKGYCIGSFDDNATTQELSFLYDDCCHAIAELESRVQELKARMKPLIALKEKVKVSIYSREFEELLDDDSFDFETEDE